jgi:hypothetical protein
LVVIEMGWSFRRRVSERKGPSVEVDRKVQDGRRLWRLQQIAIHIRRTNQFALMIRVLSVEKWV